VGAAITHAPNQLFRNSKFDMRSDSETFYLAKTDGPSHVESMKEVWVFTVADSAKTLRDGRFKMWG